MVDSYVAAFIENVKGNTDKNADTLAILLQEHPQIIEQIDYPILNVAYTLLTRHTDEMGSVLYRSIHSSQREDKEKILERFRTIERMRNRDPSGLED